jgi:sensor histidine kinase YesM
VFTAFAYMLARIYLLAKPDAFLTSKINYLIFIELIMGLIIFYTTFLGIAFVRKINKTLAFLIILLVMELLIFVYPATRHGIWEIMSSIIPHIIIIFLAVIFRKFSDSIKLEKEKQNLILQNTQSELELLKMQISPHFLFNTLNNIDYLITNDTAKASNSISRLGDILRYMIYDAKADRIMLSDEIRHIEDYIGLIRLRTSGTDFLTYCRTGQPGHKKIAPMLFIPLIENAYKHSSVKEGKDIISIEIKIENSELHFSAENEFDPSQKNENHTSGGIGLNLVKRRLELIYPGRHNFRISENNSRYNVILNLRLDEY